MSSRTPGSDPRRFPETHWSQLVEAGDHGDPRHAEHLDRLLRRYWKPTYHYVRALRRLSTEDAEDLVQGFFTMVLSRVDLARLSPDRGSFRGFLKTALRRYVADQERRAPARAVREGGASFRQAEAEAVSRQDEEPTPEEAFDRAWAREVLGQAIEKLREEMEAEGKRLYFDVFREYGLEPSDGTSYESVAAKHGIKPDDVRNYLRVVRQRGREIIRTMLRDYLFPGEDVEGELRFILSR